MPPPTLYQWLRKGYLQTRQARHITVPVWLIWADASELERLRAFRHASRPQRWPAATEPMAAKANPTAPLQWPLREAGVNPS
jgi:hypothetical protein